MAITCKNQGEEEERRSGQLITITVVSVDFVSRYNTGILVETLALEIYSSHQRNIISCRVVQLYTVCILLRVQEKIRTMNGYFSFVKSCLDKEECDNLDKTTSGEQQQSPQHLKRGNADQTKFLGLTMLKKIEEQTQEQIGNKTVHGFSNDSDLIHLNVKELLDSTAMKVKLMTNHHVSKQRKCNKQTKIQW